MIAKRLEEIKEAAERKKQAEAEKRKKFYLEHLYNNNSQRSSSYLSAYYRAKPWNSRDYVHAALDLSLEEVYKSAPLHLVADVYKKLDFEKAKIREIIRSRLREGILYLYRIHYRCFSSYFRFRNSNVLHKLLKEISSFFLFQRASELDSILRKGIRYMMKIPYVNIFRDTV